MAQNSVADPPPASSATSSATVTFHMLTLKNGWPAVDVRAPSYGISAGVVYLTGGMHQPSGTSTTFAVLPISARPKYTLWIGVFSEATTSAFLETLPTGVIRIGGSDAQFLASLAGVSFPLGS